jgi:hypothetical protein
MATQAPEGAVSPATGMQEELRALNGAERGTLSLAASTTPGK